MSLFNGLKLRSEAVGYKLRSRSRTVPFIIVILNALLGLPFYLYRMLANSKATFGDPERILIIRADRIGDMVLTTPIFKPLKERYPLAHIICMASTLSSQLIERNPYIDSVIKYDPPWFDRKKEDKIIRDYLNVLRLLRTQKFDMAIDLRGNVFNFIFLMLLAGIPQRVSFDAAFGAFLLTQAVPYEKGKHESDYFFDIVKALGGKQEPDPQAVLVLTEEEKEYAERFFRLQDITREDIIIALHPGAGQNRIYKRWPEERYSELGKALIDRFKVKIIITGSRAEINLASRIKKQIGEHAIVAAREICHLKHLAAVLKECFLCIGTSTGTLHVAAAVGTSAVVLCGPEDPRRWRPLGNNYLLIEKEVPCRPCREEICPYDGQCLRLISPECVLEVIEPLLVNRKINSSVPT